MINISRKNWFGATLSGLGIALCAASVAQGQGAVAGQAATLQLEEVVVTAEKRAVNIQDAPAAITAYSGDELVTLGVDNISQMSTLFPSARFELTGYATHLYVRGIGAEQDRIAVDQLVNMSVDGMLVPREMASAGLFDLSDVELLPGPQGTLYGASSVGGVITVQGRRPDHSTENRLLVEVGNYGAFHVTDAQNFDVSNRLAVRAAVNYSRHGAYMTSGNWTGDQLATKLGVQFDPSDRFSAYLWGLYVTDDSRPSDGGYVGYDGKWLNGGDPWDTTSCLLKACNGFADVALVPSIGKSRDYIMAGQFDWHLGNVTISDIPGVLDNDTRQQYNRYNARQDYAVRNHTVSNELRISNDSKAKMQWLAGLYYYQNRGYMKFTNGNYNLPDFKVQGVAPFGQVIYSFSDTLRGTAGLRYSSTDKVGRFEGPSNLASTKGTWSSVDWKSGVEYDLHPDTMVYATVQTGSSPGTLDAQNPVAGKARVTGTTRLASLTAGWKSRLLDNRLQFNNEVFFYDYKDFLIQTVSCPLVTCTPAQNINVFLNAPKLTTWGDQLDVKLRLTASDQVSLGAAYTHEKTGQWVTNTGANLGNQTLFHVPSLTANFGYQHAFNMENGGSTNFRIDSGWSSSYYIDFQTRPDFPVHIVPVGRQDAFTKTDMSLTYHAPREKWTLGLYAQNLENAAQKGPGGAGNPTPLALGTLNGVVASTMGVINAPRTYGIRFSAHISALE